MQVSFSWATIAAVVAVLLPIAGLLWRMSSITTTLSITLAAVKEEVEKLQENLVVIARMPEIERRLASAENTLSSLHSMSSRLAVIESQMQSIKMRRVSSPE